MAAPVGNRNAARGARWRESILRALARNAGNVDSGLDKAADKLVALALEGDKWAIDHLAERIDGKPTELHEHDGKLEVVIRYQGKGDGQTDDR